MSSPNAGNKIILMALKYLYLFCIIILIHGCSKSPGGTTTPPPPPPPATLTLTTLTVNGISAGFTYPGITTTPVIKITFSAPVNRSTVNNSFILKNSSGGTITYNVSYENSDNTVVIQPSSPLNYLTKYFLSVTTDLKSQAGGSFLTPLNVDLLTAIDPSDKFTARPCATTNI